MIELYENLIKSVDANSVDERTEFIYKLLKAENLYRLGFSLEEIRNTFHIDIDQVYIDFLNKKDMINNLFEFLNFIQFDLSEEEKQVLKKKLSPEGLVIAFKLTKDTFFIEGLQDISLTALKNALAREPEKYIPKTVLEWILFS